MAFADDLSPEAQATLELVSQLVASGSLDPLIERLRDGEVGPESAREALRVLAEFDPDLLAQITLGLITNPGTNDPLG